MYIDEFATRAGYNIPSEQPSITIALFKAFNVVANVKLEQLETLNKLQLVKDYLDGSDGISDKEASGKIDKLNIPEYINKFLKEDEDIHRCNSVNQNISRMEDRIRDTDHALKAIFHIQNYANRQKNILPEEKRFSHKVPTITIDRYVGIPIFNSQYKDIYDSLKEQAKSIKSRLTMS